MRTTVTLDDDTALLIRRRMDERGVGFKQAINDLLRESVAPGMREPFRTPVASMGAPRVDLDRALALAAELEDDELARRLERGA